MPREGMRRSGFSFMPPGLRNATVSDQWWEANVVPMPQRRFFSRIGALPPQRVFAGSNVKFLRSLLPFPTASSTSIPYLPSSATLCTCLRALVCICNCYLQAQPRAAGSLDFPSARA